MPGKAAKVVISERQHAVLTEFSKSRSEPLLLRQRATIVLLAFSGQANDEIASTVSISRTCVPWRGARRVEPNIVPCGPAVQIGGLKTLRWQTG